MIMETILKVDNLSKSMGNRLIIDNVSFETYGGEVFGFLGPNGAGKTTTIKMILGLLDQDKGQIEICGTNVKKHFEKALSHVGGIVENPETYTYLTGLQNLRQYKRMRQGVSEERLREVIRIVGLENRIGDRVKRYSLGMKQRLGVAQAILHRPRLLILDEPTNGLDPAGIRELRDILKSLAHEEGISVLISSHLLSEMELMCDRVGIITHGRMVGVRTIAELMHEASGGVNWARFRLDRPTDAVAVLKDMALQTANVTDSSLDVAVADEAQVGIINARLVGAGLVVTGIAPVGRSLEEAFLEITGKGGDQIA